MKLKSLFFSISSILIAAGVSGQINYTKTSEYLNANKYWPLAEYSAVSFFEGTAKKDTSALSEKRYSGIEPHVAVCHPITGKLLFYADYQNVYNAQHKIMLNGNDIKSGPSNSEGVVIAPYIGDSNLYYLFHYTTSWRLDTSSRIYYSIVDMRLDSGRGGIVSNKKNVLLDGDSFYVTEGLYVIAGENCDLWLIANHSDLEPFNFRQGNSYFRAYHITENGINTTPVVSQSAIKSYYTKLQRSPNGKLYAKVSLFSDGVELLEFNVQTGAFSTKYKLPIGYLSFYGGLTTDNIYSAAFSPDNSKLYLAIMPTATTGKISQFDLTKNHIDSIVKSERIINEGACVSLKLYNDTLYALTYERTTTNKNLPITINRYSNLNEDANQIRFDKDFLKYSDTCRSIHLSTEVIYPTQFYSNLIDTSVCKTDITLKSSNNDGQYFLWNDGSTDSMLSIREGGVYWVQSRRIINHCATYTTDTFYVTIRPAIEEPIVSVNVTELSTQQQTNVTYQWIKNGADINGATDYKYLVTENGDYQVRVTSIDGVCSVVSQVYEVNNATDLVNLENAVISVYPNPTNDFIYINTTVEFKAELLDATCRTLITTTDKQISLQSLANGIYQIQIYDSNGQILYKTKIAKR